MIAPMWNDEFELSDGSYSVSCSKLYQVHHEKHESLFTNHPIHIYTKKINSRLVIEYCNKSRIRCYKSCL